LTTLDGNLLFALPMPIGAMATTSNDSRQNNGLESSSRTGTLAISRHREPKPFMGYMAAAAHHARKSEAMMASKSITRAKKIRAKITVNKKGKSITTIYYTYY
jgi:hypothetical protein